MRRFVPFVLSGLALLAVPAAAQDRPASAEAATPKVAASASAPRVQPSVDAQRAAADAAVRRALARPAPKSLSEALRRLDAIKVDVNFDKMAATDAIDFIGRLAGFNVIVGPEVQAAGTEGLPTVTLRLRQVSLRQVASFVARFTQTKLAFDDGILSFTTPEAARGKPVLRIYAIGELTFKLRNFPGPDMNLRPSGAEFEPEEITDVENPFEDPEKIVEMLREFVAPESWEDEKVSITADERKLIVRQYPHVQRKIARLLAMLRAAR